MKYRQKKKRTGAPEVETTKATAAKKRLTKKKGQEEKAGRKTEGKAKKEERGYPCSITENENPTKADQEE